MISPTLCACRWEALPLQTTPLIARRDPSAFFKKAMRRDKQLTIGGESDDPNRQFTLLQRRARKQKRAQAFSDHLLKVRGPARRNPEIPILCVLAKSPKLGLECRFVREELKRKFYPTLTLEDLQARYQKSGKKIVDSIIKFAKKHLVIRGEVYALGSFVQSEVHGR